MKNLLILLALATCSVCTLAQSRRNTPKKVATTEAKVADSVLSQQAIQLDYQAKSLEIAATIRAADLEKHLRILAADSMEGRNTGEKGQKMAAQYIGSYFFYKGLSPAVPGEGQYKGKKGYFQAFQLLKESWGEVYLQTANFRLHFLESFYLLGTHNLQQETSVETVFAGYGIESDNYSDYQDLDISGKAVVIWMGEPVDKKGRSLITKTKESSDWANGWRKKANKAREKGAAQVIFIHTQDSTFQQSLAQYKDYLIQPSVQYLDSKATPTVSNGTFFLSPRMMEVLFELSPKQVKKLYKRLSKGKKPKQLATVLKIRTERKEDSVETENVLGFVEGTDKKDEIIVISSHYDHIGISPNGEINNGADDDGSGTSAVLELSEAFAQAKNEGYAPRRSLLFLTVTGEEKGLLGSRFYTENPVFPLSKTVADLNIDMIGRIDKVHADNPDYIYLIGSDKLSTQLHRISEEANAKHTQLALDYTYNDPNDSNRFYYRSDHYNFAKNNIPVIFYFNGVHPDYHRPSDDVDKINFAKMEKITRLVFHTAWELANREDRIVVDSNKK
jgi:Zn-dependent M28 family amino/carboxypeptidase